MSAQQKSGIVYLVGAGPGDPGLLTVRGRTLLELAEVVIYDYLANPMLLNYCSGAELIYVGKKAAEHTLSQEQINQVLIDHARAGKRVVRLKGGDPYIFGRGAEECIALHDAGIPFEVVPGVTSSMAGAAYAGIPVTHRDFNSSFTIITGHEKEEEYKDSESRSRQPAAGSSDLDWSVIAKLPCIAFYMGVKSLPRICQNLIENGMKPDTDAATIQWGTTPQQRTVTGTVANLPQRVAEAGITAPAITIVGKVVSLRPMLNWFETRPLFGQTVVVTRTREQASDLAFKLQQLGANIIQAPTIDVVPPQDWKQVDENLLRAGEFDWVIFTSVNGVQAARERLRELGRDVRVFGNAKIAAIGGQTAMEIQRRLALHVELCPANFVAEALADELSATSQIAGRKFLLLRADIGREILLDRLKAGEAQSVVDVAIYQTLPAKSLPAGLVESIDEGHVQWVTFTSSSTATNFVKLLGPDYLAKLKNVKLASIGPITTQMLKELGLSPHVQAETFNIDGLVQAMLAAR